MAQDRTINEKSTGSTRGFASMSPDRQREIASKGGQSVSAEKRSFSQNRDLAAQAGRKGGQAPHGGGRGRGAEDDKPVLNS